MLKLPHIIDQLDEITLEQMDNVKLMDRTDTKYTFSFDQLSGILTTLKENYRVLVVENKRVSRYETLYFDTPSFDLYMKHHSGKLNRYKIRHRTYVDSHTGFLEVKFKNNKSRTIKSRIKKNRFAGNFDTDCADFLRSAFPSDYSKLTPVIWVNYNRLTLVNKHSAERVTIDLGLEFVNQGKKIQFENLVIAEVKQDKKTPSPFIQVMKQLHIREGSISKYCMGIAVSCKGVKTNNFKEKLLNIKQYK